MKRIKKAIRLLALVCLIILACLGIGMSGGVPLPQIKNRRDAEKDAIELVDNQEEEGDSEVKEIQ